MDPGGREEIRHEVQMGQTEREPRAPQQRRSPQVRRPRVQRNTHPEDVHDGHLERWTLLSDEYQNTSGSSDVPV